MQLDSQISRRINDVSKGILDLDFITFGCRKEVVAHGQSSGFIDDDVGILKSHFGPSVNCKPIVFRAFIV